MGRHKNLDKCMNSRDGTSSHTKNVRNGGLSVNDSVSDSISRANSVLFGDDSIFDINSSVSESPQSSLNGSMSESGDKSTGVISVGVVHE